MSVVKIDADILSGTPCFSGTRVPASTLVDYLEAGHTLEDFLNDFPTVSRDRAITFLREGELKLVADAAAA
jgi:uncharacterized protein (DUF433 family)